ncbi:MAG: zinc-ribbon domain-containing protein [Thaumarchaeota archaeon]|nr:zinc-ribbon domain-containing protein [Nitrososphaerota archaeon]
MAFCPNCGKEVSPQAVTCPNCGHPLKQTQPPAEQISAWWWLLPLFFSWIGGIIAYFVLKDRNQRTATNMLIFGIVWTIAGVIITIAFFGFLFGLAGAYTHP